MDKSMTGAERREKIIELLRQASTPMSGEAIGKKTGVSRQIVVQDITLLRAAGHTIVATARGYVLDEPKQITRLLKVCHTNDQIEDELTTIVDLGGCIADVMINHRVYGRMAAPLNIKNRRDVSTFLNNLKTGKSSALLNVTGGYHFHHITAEREEILDEIEAALKEKKYIADFMPYEDNLTKY